MSAETGLFHAKIPYIKGGSGPKSLVFFYGGSALLTSLDKSSVRDHLRVIEAYVPAGYTYYVFGYEQNPAKTYGLNQIADDFADIIRAEIGKTVIVGVSFGGFVAMRFAAKYPELTDKLVLLVSGHCFSAAGEQKIGRMLALAQQGCMYEMMKELSLLFRRWWLNMLARFLLWKNNKRIVSGLNSRDAIISSLEGICVTDVRNNTDYLGRIAAKTIVIGGTQDQFFGEDQFRETAQYINNAALRMFTEETHMLPVERRKDVAGMVKSFIVSEP